MKAVYKLKINRLVGAPREKAFDAWVRPESLKRFLKPDASYAVSRLEADVRAGGKFRLDMRNPGGKTFAACGLYETVSPDEKIAFTWKRESGGRQEPGETLVTVEFLKKGSGTELVFTHDLFPTEAERDGHLEAWTGCIALFDEFITNHSQGE